MNANTIFSALSIVSGFASAGLWFYSARVKVTPEQARIMSQKILDNRTSKSHARWTHLDGSDSEFTAKMQSKWNGYGAIAAGISVLCQAIANWINIA